MARATGNNRKMLPFVDTEKPTKAAGLAQVSWEVLGYEANRTSTGVLLGHLDCAVWTSEESCQLEIEICVNRAQRNCKSGTEDITL